ncbi:TPA: hypothetical protein ACH3X3_011867 [Trebouxia sp. C0006]
MGPTEGASILDMRMVAKIIQPMVQSAMDLQGKQPLSSEAISANSMVTMSAATAQMRSQKLSVRGFLAKPG